MTKQTFLILFLLLLPGMKIHAQLETLSSEDIPSGYLELDYYDDLRSVDGVLYIYRDNAPLCLMKYPASRPGTDYTVLSGTKRVAQNAFEGAKSLQRIFLPPSVYHIGDNTFTGCTSLQGIYSTRDATAIQQAQADSQAESNTPREVARYTLSGRACTPDEKGVQIIVFSDFTTQTILVE